MNAGAPLPKHKLVLSSDGIDINSERAAHMLMARCYSLLGNADEAAKEQQWIEAHPNPETPRKASSTHVKCPHAIFCRADGAMIRDREISVANSSTLITGRFTASTASSTHSFQSTKNGHVVKPRSRMRDRRERPLGPCMACRSPSRAPSMSPGWPAKQERGCGRDTWPKPTRLWFAIEAAGAIVLGNTTVPEFLMAWETDSALYGRTNSPWDLTRTPGGSSGGEAAAIASCCSAGGIGSDGGGSIRVPAHFSGICGLKPTPGRVPATGHYPPSVGPFALLGVVGPMARTVADLTLLFEVIAGPDSGDPNAAPVPLQPVDHATLLRTRIGYFDDDGRVPVTAETRIAIQRTVQALRDQGFTVEPFVPEGLDEALRLWHALFIDGVAMVLRQAYKGREDEMHSIVREILRLSEQDPKLTAESLLDVLFRRDIVRAKFLGQMERYPLLVCPVSAIPAFATVNDRGPSATPRSVSGCVQLFAVFQPARKPRCRRPHGRSAEACRSASRSSAPWEEERVWRSAGVSNRPADGQEPPIA